MNCPACKCARDESTPFSKCHKCGDWVCPACRYHYALVRGEVLEKAWICAECWKSLQSPGRYIVSLSETLHEYAPIRMPVGRVTSKL